MKLLTFGLFIAAITVQISAVDIVQEREDGEGDLESRIDVETEEERVKALDVESRKLDAKECPCKIYKVEASGWKYYDPDNPGKLKVFGGEFKKKYSKDGNLGRQYDVIWEQTGTGNVIAGLEKGVWSMGKWSNKRLYPTFVMGITGQSDENICPDSKKLVNKWKYKISRNGRFFNADGKEKIEWKWKYNYSKRTWTRKKVGTIPPKVIKVTCKKREDKKPRLTNTNKLSRRPRPNRQKGKAAFGGRRTNTAQSQKKNKCTYSWCT